MVKKGLPSRPKGEPVPSLVIMAKEPVAGEVKTRLVPPFSPEQAAAFYRCLLEDTVDLVRGAVGVRGGIAYSPSSARGWFRRLAPPDFLLLPQGSGDLGARLEGVFRVLFASGAAAVCLMNSDGPDLPAAHVGEAFRILAGGEAEAVFGPNPDGGYYLVGLGREAPLFAGVPWSTPRVLETSLENARRAGIEAKLLPSWPDLDSLYDVEAAFRRWKSGFSTPPRRSFAFLSAFFGSGNTP